MKGNTGHRGGPPPDPAALRHGNHASWTVLPVEGREGPPPAWPLTAATKRETVLWASQWRRPQAVMWQRLRLFEEVGLYVRSLAAAEKHDASVASRTLVRQQQESLGVSIPGMYRNKWKIGDQGAEAPVTSRGTAETRERFSVVPGGKGESA